MKWQNSVQVFIDPFIKENNRYLIEKAAHLGAHRGHQIIYDKSNLKDLLQSKIIIFEELTEFINELKSDSSHYFIQIDQPNLDLFSEQQRLEKSFSVKDEQELENIFGVLDTVLESSTQNLRKKIIQSGKNNFKELTNQAHKTADLNNKQIEIIAKLEHDIFEIYEISEIIECLQSINSQLTSSGLSIKTLGEILFENRQSLFIPLTLSTDNTLFLCWEKGTFFAKEILAIYQVLEDCFQNHSVLLKSIESRLKWEGQLSNFDLPIVIFDNMGGVLIHNKHFIELNLSSKDCLSFEHNDQITIRKNIYRVIKKNDENENKEYIFVPVNEFLVQSDKPSYEELGIISSSVAHELNNPLAGISAALDLLLLDEFSDETTSELREMKKGVLRCRNLVEIFLGFSKVKTEQTPTINKISDIEDIFGHAVELIRFRLIENNVSLKVDYKQRQKIQVSFDDSVMTMIFYLLLGEILTGFSHHNLVIGGGGKKLLIKFEEESELIRITFSKDINIQRSFLDSKLISHLFDLLNSHVSLDENVITMNL